MDTTSDDFVPVDDWSNLPQHLLTNIIEYLSWNDRLQATAVCRRWRSALFAPTLWRNIVFTIQNKHDRDKISVLKECVKYAYFISVRWCHGKGYSMALRPRPCDSENRQLVRDIIYLLKENGCLQKMEFHLEDPASWEEEFCTDIRKSMEIILAQSDHLKYLSFGCDPFLLPECCLDVLSSKTLSRIESLHVGTLPPRTGSYSFSKAERLTMILTPASVMCCLTSLSMDWRMMSDKFLHSFAQRLSAQPLKMMQLFFSHHCDCLHSENPALFHPSPSTWAAFNKQNPDMKLFFVFVFHLDGICPAVENISLPFCIKILECPHLDTSNLERIVIWHRESIQGLMFINTLTSPVYDPASGIIIGGLMQCCHNLKYISIIGRFVPSESILWMAQTFHPTQLLVTKAHILTTAEASNYLIPISATKYTNFKRDMRLALQRPWEALERPPLKGYYFSDGNDNNLYLTGSLM